jgi:dTDP-glucose 4,6-dehydratase
MLKILFDAPGSRPYNVGSDFSVTIAELADIIARLKHPEMSVKILRQQSDGKKDIYVPSVRRTMDELGLDKHFDLEEAIRLTVRWHANIAS